MRGWRRKALVAVPAALILGFVTYEAAAVARAKARTPAILEQAADRPLRLAAVPKRRLAMLLAVEDPGFYRHKGIDFSTPGQGKTNLTQSLVKFLYFDHFRPGFAKIEQSLIARFVLHPAMSKDDQLELYLNRARFGWRGGREIRGFAEAARAYYGKPFGALSDGEYLGLVAMLIAPRDLDPLRHRAANAERVGRIERLLAGRCRPAGLFDVRYPACRAG
jgi:membrane carboxypeptidase/penicillin-binding protein